MVASQPRILRDEAEATAAEAVAGGGGVDCRFSLEMANERALERVFAAGCRPPASERASEDALMFPSFLPFSVSSVAKLETGPECSDMAHIGTKSIRLS